MAEFIGKQQLEENITAKGLSPIQLKGLEGELRVGDLLAEYLPNDNYVIAHPSIGKYDPDFLVISPKYGFRLVEVKNWNIGNITELHSNGAIKIYNSLQNPLNQVKRHSEELNSFIQSLGISALNDPFRMIGYIVIHTGFTKSQVSSKVASWDSATKESFFKFHIFADQLGFELNYLLEKANKFSVSHTQIFLNDQIVKKILNSITVTSDITYDTVHEINNKLVEVDNKLSTLDANIKELQKESERPGSHNINRPIIPQNNISKKPWLYISIILSLILFTSGFLTYQKILKNPEEVSAYKVIGQVKDNAEPGKYVEVQATLDEFRYDKKSGTKFLVVSDGVSTINAVVFKDKEIPFLREGETYIFKGKLKDYKGELEIVIDSVD